MTNSGTGIAVLLTLLIGAAFVLTGQISPLPLLSVHACNTCGLLLSWGSYGYENGKFNQPTGITVDSSGYVYVADDNYGRIEKFTSNGEYVTQWGWLGVGNGQFDVPWGVAVDSSGNVYVADSGNHRVQKFTSQGNYLLQWVAKSYLNAPPLAEPEPYGIAVDSAGNVYVTDCQNDAVVKFGFSGSSMTSTSQWGSHGSIGGDFFCPEGVAVDSSGNVYVADNNNNRVEKFTSNGGYLAQWGSQGSGNGQFSGPTGVAVDSSGNVYVVDSGNDRVEKFTNDGAYITQWGSLGYGNGQFKNPEGLAVDSSGNVYVVDSGNDRVEKFGDQYSTLQTASQTLGVVTTQSVSQSGTSSGPTVVAKSTEANSPNPGSLTSETQVTQTGSSNVALGPSVIAPTVMILAIIMAIPAIVILRGRKSTGKYDSTSGPRQRCWKCGALYERGSSYCEKCGASLSQSE